ncbi:MAG: SRPBCC domain-containing protein [Chloroflexia bacterium]|nr:SRPBCC domain-containing protein [Chloroflexia bacterium]
MTVQKAFEVEVKIDAAPDRVWAAVTDPAAIERWHGWDYDGLAAEIQYIYVDHATLAPPDRLIIADETGGQEIVLVPDGSGTRIRVTRPGEAAVDQYDMIEEGWRSFFQQLRHYLERHPDEERRTIFLEGDASPAAVVADLRAKVAGRDWHADRYQAGIATDDFGGGLVILASGIPVAADETGPMMITLTTHGLDDEVFAATKRGWLAWWSGLAQNPRLTSAP